VKTLHPRDSQTTQLCKDVYITRLQLWTHYSSEIHKQLSFVRMFTPAPLQL